MKERLFDYFTHKAAVYLKKEIQKELEWPPTSPGYIYQPKRPRPATPQKPAEEKEP